MAEQSLYQQLKDLNQFEQEIKAEKDMLIEKSLRNPSSPKDVVFATKLLQERYNGGNMKAFLLDPLNTDDMGGYRSRPLLDLSFNTLRSMAKQTGLISAIIQTRKEQVASYSSYSYEDVLPGWKIEKNIVNYFKEDEIEDAKKLNQEERKEVSKLISFIENCGLKNRLYDREDFDSFLRKYVEDSLTIDNSCFEIVPSKLGLPYEFFMVDGATIRFASVSLEEEKEKIRGYAPHAVQLYQQSLYTYFYPWELSIGIRNPSTNYIYNGYGVSELELLVKIVTYILYAETYTGRFFSQGSNPKGLFIAKDNISEDKIQEFRQTWQSQTVGLTGAHKIPLISGADLQWVDMQKANTDMEFSNWLDYLTRLTCCIFKIDPSELGYKFSSEGSVNYDSSIQEKINYSKEKGLVPLLKFIENKINHYLIFPLSNSKYKFKFTGLDNTASIIENLDLTRVEKGVMTFGEYRKKHGLPTEIEENDFLLNSIWIQYKQLQAGQQQGGGGEGMPMMPQQMLHNHEESRIEGKSIFSDFVNENPFARDLDKFIVEKGWK